MLDDRLSEAVGVPVAEPLALFDVLEVMDSLAEALVDVEADKEREFDAD